MSDEGTKVFDVILVAGFGLKRLTTRLIDVIGGKTYQKLNI